LIHLKNAIVELNSCVNPTSFMLVVPIQDYRFLPIVVEVFIKRAGFGFFPNQFAYVSYAS